MRYEFDFLVIGSGIAGLSFALKVAEYGKVCVLTKADASEGSTKYAQGGIAAVMYDSDSFDRHISDTLVAGDGICDEEVVRMTICEAPNRIKELVRYGVNFDKNSDGSFDLHREGGHSDHRILHHKDSTGAEVERGLLQEVKNHPNIIIKENQYAVDLITQHHLGIRVTRHTPDIVCYGVYVLNSETHKVDTYLAKVTLLATGGLGNVYATTTNPVIATGDGVAMVLVVCCKIWSLCSFTQQVYTIRKNVRHSSSPKLCVGQGLYSKTLKVTSLCKNMMSENHLPHAISWHAPSTMR